MSLLKLSLLTRRFQNIIFGVLPLTGVDSCRRPPAATNREERPGNRAGSRLAWVDFANHGGPGLDGYVLDAFRHTRRVRNPCPYYS
jgi:hypothetical protein